MFICFTFRKPKNLGTELKSVASKGCNGPMIYAEIQQGKQLMSKRQWFREYGATTACVIRMVQGTVNCGQRPDDTKRDLYYGDSWFASLKTAMCCSELCKSEFIGIVKTAHRGYPKAYLESKMQTWPPGTHLILEYSKNCRKYFAIGYKYSVKKVICFVATEKAGHTLPGDPYVAKWVDANDAVRFRKITRPHLISNFFKHSNQIDKHNHARQSELAIEENVVTHCGYMRLYCTYLGITITDAWKLYRHNLGSRHEFKNMSIMRFSNILCKQLLENKFNDTKMEDTHIPNLNSLTTNTNPTSRQELDFPNTISLEETTAISSLGTASVVGSNRQIGPGKFLPSTYTAYHDDAVLVPTPEWTTTGAGSYSRRRKKRGKCQKCGLPIGVKCSCCGNWYCDLTAHERPCFIEHKAQAIATELDNHWCNLQNN